MDVVQPVDDLQVAVQVGQRHLPPLARLEVEDVGGGAQAGETHAVPADLHLEVGIVAVEGEGGGGLLERPLHQALGDAHRLRPLVHLRPGLAEQLTGLAVVHLDADLRQDLHRGGVDALDLLLAEHLEARCLHSHLLWG